MPAGLPPVWRVASCDPHNLLPILPHRRPDQGLCLVLKHCTSPDKHQVLGYVSERLVVVTADNDNKVCVSGKTGGCAAHTFHHSGLICSTGRFEVHGRGHVLVEGEARQAAAKPTTRIPSEHRHTWTPDCVDMLSERYAEVGYSTCQTASHHLLVSSQLPTTPLLSHPPCDRPPPPHHHHLCVLCGSCVYSMDTG